MSIERYIQLGTIGLGLCFTIINILILCVKRRKVNTTEEKQAIDDEIKNVALNAFNYLQTYCRQNGYTFNAKEVKKEFKKEIKKSEVNSETKNFEK